MWGVGIHIWQIKLGNLNSQVSITLFGSSHWDIFTFSEFSCPKLYPTFGKTIRVSARRHLWSFNLLLVYLQIVWNNRNSAIMFHCSRVDSGDRDRVVLLDLNHNYTFSIRLRIIAHFHNFSGPWSRIYFCHFQILNRYNCYKNVYYRYESIRNLLIISVLFYSILKWKWGEINLIIVLPGDYQFLDCL